MILLIDNYDSFTYNLFQYLSDFGEEVKVIRNDKISLDEVAGLSPDKIVISPGPGVPERAGISVDLIQRFGGKIPILGVCLGHQCIGYAYGAVIEEAGELVHGKTSLIYHDGRGVFRGLPNPFDATRYHSLAIRRENLPECLEISAWTSKGLIMGVRHREYPIEGVQFHPESIMTRVGKDLLRNFLEARFSTIKEAISLIVSGGSLSMEEAKGVMEEIMSGRSTPAQIGAFVAALRMKGETVEEIAGLAWGMREKATRVMVRGPVVDTAGTGGDGKGTFNISTTAAFVVVGAGLLVAKHGNRAITSHCGSADVLERLGIKIDMAPEQVAQCLEKVGIGFFFAPSFHPAMRYAAHPRREIGIWSAFNILGPLTNPAGARFQLVGVADAALTLKMAQALLLLGCRHAFVVHGEDGLDEISISDRTTVCEVKDGSLTTYSIAPEDFGMSRAPIEEIMGGTLEDNARMLRAVLEGERGARRDIVVLNAAAALVAGEKAPSLREGVGLAQESIDRGRALAKLEELIDFCRGMK